MFERECDGSNAILTIFREEECLFYRLILKRYDTVFLSRTKTRGPQETVN